VVRDDSDTRPVLSAVAAWHRRAATRLGWRPDLRTAAVLIGAFFLYQTTLSLRGIPALVDELEGNCGSLGAGFNCSEPPWVFIAAVIGVAAVVADLLVVAGAAMLLFGDVARGRLVTVAGLVVIAGLQVAGAVNLLASGNAGVNLTAVWTELLTAVAALLLAAFVTLLRVG
jgi:hypothetical protein